MAFGTSYHSTGNNATETFLRTLDREELMREVAARFLGIDYFSRDEHIRLGSLRSAAALGGFGEREAYSIGEAVRDEDIRRINVTAQLANSTVTPRMQFAEIHPKLTSDGRFPRDFVAPKRVEDFLTMDNPPLDRLLLSYSLPRDMSSLSAVRRPGGGLGSGLGARLCAGLGTGLMRQDSFALGESAREAKLRTLFEFLGVDLWDERRGVLGGLGGDLGTGIGMGVGAGAGLLGDRLGDRLGAGRLGCERGLERGRLL